MATQDQQLKRQNREGAVASRSSIGGGARQTAPLRYLRIAPRKVRLIASLLSGMPVNEAEAQLVLQRQRAAKPLLKLLRSAVANAQNNQKLDPQKLVIESFRVDQGPMLKRMLPRARGSGSPIQKKMSHVTIVLTESEKPMARYKIVHLKKTKLPGDAKSVLRKKGAAKESKDKNREPQVVERQEKSVQKEGFFRRTFRRKAV